MSTMGEIPELTYELIQKATNGDPAALEMILKHYEPYHNALSAYETVNANGRVRCEIDEDIKAQISMMFDKMLADNCQARELDSDGEYTLVSDGKEPLNSQEFFYDLAYERASKAEVEDK